MFSNSHLCVSQSCNSSEILLTPYVKPSDFGLGVEGVNQRVCLDRRLINELSTGLVWIFFHRGWTGGPEICVLSRPGQSEGAGRPPKIRTGFRV